MREKIYYMLAIAVLLVAIAGLVVVFGQNQPSTAQPTQTTQQQSAGNSLQTVFTTLATRAAQNAQFSFSVRVTGSNNTSGLTAATVNLGANGSKITDVGSDFFCFASANSKLCIPYAQVLSVQIPT